ncbi:hypothetical protein Rhopal_002253-T1 [Rhodotorula paludigena]|uniref:HTH TFE/IIEalpha-type domain-containing protein n=1 Tax=Rhodotorula paludigena TaxID=86838 RepID=A0AAV5GFG7_9BASI|nr:hypothetical protein Rhopal_002253-T1 [Rhodotorula paludigena]
MASAAPSSVQGQDGLDTARLLVQKIVRTFYGNRAAILVDQLVQKEVFRDEEVAKRLGMQIKDITKIAHRLVEDQIVQIHRRSEMRDNGMMKAQQRGYYYVDYSKATDVIKWRMWRIQQTIDVKLRNELDAQGYVCPLCKASYTPLDAASLYDPMRNLLACGVCQTEVVNNENEEDVKGNKDRMQRLNRQTKGIVDLLKKLEKVQLPRFNVEAYLAIHGPALGITAAAAAEANGTAAPQAAVVKVHLAGDDDEANEKARRERELQQKRAQNALPSWIAQSTISSAPEQPGVSAPAGEGDRAQIEPFSSSAAAGGATLRMGDEDKPSAAALAAAAGGSDPAEAGDADLDAYYASLENAQPAEDQSTPVSASATPAAFAGEADSPDFDSLAGTPSAMDATRAGTEEQADADVVSSAKRDREDEEDDDEDSGASKRARLDGSLSASATDSPAVAAVDTSEPLAAGAEEEEEDDDDFDEFEPGGGDPNQLISVNGKMMPFSEVTEDMTGDMAYWEVYQQVNA